MIYAAFFISFLASGISVWRIVQTNCAQREAHIGLVALPIILAVLLYFNQDTLILLAAFAMLFMGGIAVASERGWLRLPPIYQIFFALYLLINVSNSA